MFRSVAVVVVVAVVSASCSSPTGQDMAPNTTVPATSEATSTTPDRSVPAADWLSVSSVFGASLDGPSFRGGLNIVNGSDSVIAASSLIVEIVQDATVNTSAVLVGNGMPLTYLTPGSNWFAFSVGDTTPVVELRLFPPEAEYAEIPGTFDTTIEIEQRPGGALVSGKIVSAWPTDLNVVRVDIVWFDASGKPIFGRSELVPTVSVAEPVRFEFETLRRIDDSWTYVAGVVETQLRIVSL